jgi:polysaccharide export outer membrane protein
MILSRTGNIARLFSVILLVLLFSSCASKEKIIYLQNAQAGSSQEAMKYETKLQPDDELLITVTASRHDLVNKFNLMYLNMSSTEMRTMTDERLFSYLIDQNGEINFPTIGKIKLSGLTRTEAEAKIRNIVREYVVDAEVSVRVLNFEISVMGEVARPGVQVIRGDRVTLLEALSAAGDLTIYGNRENIKLVREVDGATTVTEIDITKADFINSPYYYLAHNDVLYVEPNKTRVNSSVIGPNVTVAISAISLLITIIALSTR